MIEYLLVLGANQFLRERSLVGAKNIRDYEVWTSVENALFEYNNYFDFCLDANPLDYEALIKEIESYKMLGYTPKSVIPLNDWTLAVANKINKTLGLPYLAESTVRACRNKEEMKRLLEENGVATPKSRSFTSEKELKKLLKFYEFPVIIKPVDFGGSGGVYLAQSQKEVIDAYYNSKKTMERYANDFKVSNSVFLIEEFIDSNDEVSVEVLCGKRNYEVITVTEKYLSPRPWFAEMGHVVPSHRYENKAITSLAINACKALKIDRGLAHVEIKIQKNNLNVIEVAARPGGDGIMDLIEDAYKVNPYELHISSYLNNDLDSYKVFEPQKVAAIAFMKADKGIITQLNKSNVQKHKNIKRISLFKNVGDQVMEPENWSSREGLIQFTFDKMFENKTDYHIKKAKEITTSIFKVEASDE